MRFSADVLKEELDAGLAMLAGNRLRFFAGPPAATRGQFPAGAVLATVTCPAPLFNPSTWEEATKRLTANKVAAALQDVSADAGGTVGSFAFDNNGVFRGDGTVGTQAQANANPGTIDMIVDQTTVAAGAPFVVQSLTRTRTVG